ncbi:MAG: CDP-alcohol phosphatidyltransferase family protein [Chlamydia sp.]
MKRKIALPNVMTAIGLTVGLFIIFKLSALTPNGITHKELASCLNLFIIAAVIDTFDGAIARAMRLESDFGGLFDSMSDAVTFGVAPSVFVLKALSFQPRSLESALLLMAVTAYSIAGIIRLVRFSTAYVPPEQKSVFTGLPIPAAAFSVASLTLFVIDLVAKDGMDQRVALWTVITALFFISYMMVSRWRFPSLKSINIHFHAFHLVAFLAASTAFFFFLFSNDSALAFCFVCWSYIIGSWSAAIWRLSTGKRHLAINDHSDFEEIEKESSSLL